MLSLLYGFVKVSLGPYQCLVDVVLLIRFKIDG
jgi:hypothetical protein